MANKKIIFFVSIFAIFCLFFSGKNVFAKTCGPAGYDLITWDCLDTESCGSNPKECIPNGGGNGGGGGNNDWPPKGNTPKTDVNSCCQLSHTIKFDGLKFNKGCVVGAEEKTPGAYCVLNGTDLIEKGYMKEKINPSLSTGDNPCGWDEPATAYNKWGMLCLVSTIYSVADWMFFILLIIAIIMFVLAGWYFLTSAGDPKKVESTRNMIIYGMIGLLVAVLAKIAPSLVLSIVK